MGLDPWQFLEFVVRPTLAHLSTAGVPESVAAEKLLMATALHESAGLCWLSQLSGGPARGVFQMEKTTFLGLLNWLGDYKLALDETIADLLAPEPSSFDQLRTNLAYATAIARANYWRHPDPLPDANDHPALGAYAKRVWNTEAGKATALDYELALDRVAHLWEAA